MQRGEKGRGNSGFRTLIKVSRIFALVLLYYFFCIRCKPNHAGHKDNIKPKTFHFYFHCFIRQQRPVDSASFQKTTVLFSSYPE